MRIIQFTLSENRKEIMLKKWTGEERRHENKIKNKFLERWKQKDKREVLN